MAETPSATEPLTMNTFSSVPSPASPTPVPPHHDEWLASGVAPSLIPLNTHWLEGESIFDLLYGHCAFERTNTGRLAGKWLARYRNCEQAAGWVVSGIDPHTWADSACFRFKQTAGDPLVIDAKGKPAKYLSPKGQQNRAVLLRVGPEEWTKCASRHHIPIEEIDQEQGFWFWVWRHQVPLILTEGEKKAGCLLSQGWAAISIPGIWSGIRSLKNAAGQKVGLSTLIPDLAKFDTLSRQITICFDYRPETEIWYQREFKAALRLAECFKNAGVNIALLPGPEKGIDDFVVAGGNVDELIHDAVSYQYLKAQQDWRLTYKPAVKLNQRYLGEIPFPDSGIVAIKSPKGTGKTYCLQNLIDEAGKIGRKALYLSHRISLGRQTCKGLGLSWIDDMKEDDREWQDGSLFGFGLCIDSLHPLSKARFNPEEWHNAIIILDEIEQVIWHLLSSSTCQGERVSILKTFTELIRTVMAWGGLIIALDADLSDVSLDYLKGLRGDSPSGGMGGDFNPYLIVNEWQENPWQVTFFDTKQVKGVSQNDPSGVLNHLVNQVNDGAHVWVALDTQKAKSQWGSKNIETYLRTYCPGKRILRIDLETTSDPSHPACRIKEADLNGLVTEYDIVICSPTVASGISVDVQGHFTAVYGIFQGCIPENEARQALARVRESVPRLVWCRERGVNTVAGGESSYKALMLSRHRYIRKNLEVLRQVDVDIFDGENQHHLKCWARMGARINASAWNYRQSLMLSLKLEGHQVTLCADSDQEVTTAMKSIRLASMVDEAVAVASAPDISEAEYEQLQEKRSKTEVQRYTERKHSLKQKYGQEEITPELKLLDDDQWYGKIRLHYYLLYPEILEAKESQKAQGTVKGSVFPTDVRLDGVRVKVLLALNILQFTDESQQWDLNSPAVVQIAHQLQADPYNCKLFLGFNPSKMTPIQVIQTLLRLVGLRLVGQEQRVKGTKDKVRVYRFGGPCRFQVPAPGVEGEGLRDAVFAAWYGRDLQSLGLEETVFPLVG